MVDDTFARLLVGRAEAYFPQDVTRPLPRNPVNRDFPRLFTKPFVLGHPPPVGGRICLQPLEVIDLIPHVGLALVVVAQLFTVRGCFEVPVMKLK